MTPNELPLAHGWLPEARGFVEGESAASWLLEGFAVDASALFAEAHKVPESGPPAAPAANRAC